MSLYKELKSAAWVQMAVVGAVGGYLYPIPKKLVDYGMRHLRNTLVVSSDNDDYKHFNTFVKRNCPKFTDYYYGGSFKSLQWDAGTYHFKFNGKPVTVVKKTGASGKSVELVFYLYFTDVQELYNEVEKIQQEWYATNTFTSVTEVPSASGFSGGMQRTKRFMNTVYLNEDIKEDLLNAFSQFRSGKEWYDKLGIPHKLVVLLHGPPGTGKTSILKGIAAEFGMEIKKLNFAGRDFSDETLCNIVKAAASLNNLIIIEDIDRIFHSEGTLTMSGLLNVMDGVSSPDSMCVIMTTNHVDKLDEALIRAGRVDHTFYIGFAGTEQVINYFMNFYEGKVSLDEAKAFAMKVGHETVPMANVQAYLMGYKDDPREALLNAHTHFVIKPIYITESTKRDNNTRGSTMTKTNSTNNEKLQKVK